MLELNQNTQQTQFCCTTLNRLSANMRMGDIQTFLLCNHFIYLHFLEHIILILLMKKLRHRRITSIGLGAVRDSSPGQASKSPEGN